MELLHDVIFLVYLMHLILSAMGSIAIEKLGGRAQSSSIRRTNLRSEENPYMVYTMPFADIIPSSMTEFKYYTH